MSTQTNSSLLPLISLTFPCLQKARAIKSFLRRQFRRGWSILELFRVLYINALTSIDVAIRHNSTRSVLHYQPSAGVRCLVWVLLPDENRWEEDSTVTPVPYSQDLKLPFDAHFIRWEPEKGSTTSPFSSVFFVPVAQVRWGANQTETLKVCVTPNSCSYPRMWLPSEAGWEPAEWSWWIWWGPWTILWVYTLLHHGKREPATL